MKETEFKLISELMKDARRSDRDLAKVIGASQPTVSRLRTKLEKEGIIREYAMIPDFHKIGYEILAVTFLKLKGSLSGDELSKIRTLARERMQKSPYDMIMMEKGMGLGYDGMTITFHKDYSAYMEFRGFLRGYPFLENVTDSFLVDLSDKEQYLPLTLSVLAKHMKTNREEKKT